MDDLGTRDGGSPWPDPNAWRRKSGAYSRGAGSLARAHGSDPRDPGEFDRMMTNYDPPIGNAKFIAALGRPAARRNSVGASVRKISPITAGGQNRILLLIQLARW